MNCEECDSAMRHHDYKYIGNYSAYLNGRPDSGYKVVSDVWQCDNEECEAYQVRIEVPR